MTRKAKIKTTKVKNWPKIAYTSSNRYTVIESKTPYRTRESVTATPLFKSNLHGYITMYVVLVIIYLKFIAD